MTEMKLQEDIYLSFVSQRLMEQRENKLRAGVRVTGGENSRALVMNKKICTKVEIGRVDSEGVQFKLYAQCFSIFQAELNVGFLYLVESQGCLIDCSMPCHLVLLPIR